MDDGPSKGRSVGTGPKGASPKRENGTIEGWRPGR